MRFFWLQHTIALRFFVKTRNLIFTKTHDSKEKSYYRDTKINVTGHNFRHRMYCWSVFLQSLFLLKIQYKIVISTAQLEDGKSEE